MSLYRMTGHRPKLPVIKLMLRQAAETRLICYVKDVKSEKQAFNIQK